MSYYYKYLFENNLYEGLVKSSDVVGQLINKLDFNLKEQEYKSEYDHPSFDEENGQRINTYYIFVQKNYNYKQLSFSIKIKCRVSNHIKPIKSDQEDLDVLVPNQNKFRRYTKNKFFIFNNNTFDEYFIQGIKDIKTKIEYLYSELKKIIDDIIDDYNSNYRILSSSQKLTKYPELERFEEEKWFKDFIEEQELIYKKSLIIQNKEKRLILSLKKSENPTP